MHFLAGIRSSLTYANIVSSLCLFLVLGGGTAVALSGSNTVFSDDIKNGEVKAADIGSGQVRSTDIGTGQVASQDVKNNNLRGADIFDGTLSGADVDEGSLGEVPSANIANEATNAFTAVTANNATNATNATHAQNSDTVDNLHARRIAYKRTSGAGREEILNIGALRLEASCNSSTNLEIFAKTTSDGSYIRSSNEADKSFNIGDEVEVQNAGNGITVVGYRGGPPGGYGVNLRTAVTVTLAYDEGGDVCDLTGTALGG